MSLEAIELISCGYFEKWLLEEVSRGVEREFTLPVRYKDGHIDLSQYYNPSRRQYDGNLLLKELDKYYGSDSWKAMGLFSIDLFIPILTYIFGQAFLNGRSGIASIYRLHNERYGLKKDDEVLVKRLSKEVIHELGHTFGLIHCHDTLCVMRSSTYVEDIDQKSQHLCSKCRGKISIDGWV